MEAPTRTHNFADLAGLTVAGSIGFLLIPLSIGAAIIRYRLYDIDVIINPALVYGSLTAVLVRALTGQESQLAIVASTLAIAALFGPLRRRIQNVIDRRFYRKKHAARIMAAFGVRLRDEVDLNTLSDDGLEVVIETVQPAHASLWLRPAGGTPAGKREETDLQRLGATLVSVVEKTVQPEHVSLCLRTRDPGTRR